MTPSHLEKLAEEYALKQQQVPGSATFDEEKWAFRDGGLAVLAEALPLINDVYQFLGGHVVNLDMSAAELSQGEEMLDRLMGFCERWDDNEGR